MNSWFNRQGCHIAADEALCTDSERSALFRCSHANSTNTNIITNQGIFLNINNKYQTHAYLGRKESQMGRYNFNQRTRDGYEISPEQAAKWLERNDNNRNVNVAKVKKMAKDMREGHWDTTHQGIAIASDGTLVDGQHRLLAIVESGVTVRMNVTFNAAKSQHIDSGNIRSMANRVQMSEYDMSWTNNTILSAANLIGRLFAGSNLSHEEALSEWLMRYRTQIESTSKCIKKLRCRDSTPPVRQRLSL